MRSRWKTPAGLAAVALIAAAWGTAAGPASAGSSPAGASAAPAMRPPGGLRTARIHGVTVLTNARGRTLYWFARDSASRSNCGGPCARAWPPVNGPVAAGRGVTGRLGTIRRPDGSIQASYDGHPLYTFTGDMAPGQASGNGLNAFGGLWHEVTAGRAATPPR